MPLTESGVSVHAAGLIPDACLQGQGQPLEWGWKPHAGPRPRGLAVVRECHPEGLGPPERGAATTFYDAETNSAYLFGGAKPFKGLVYNDTWRLDLEGGLSWTQVSDGHLEAIPRRYLATGIVDPVARRLVVYGGVGIEEVGGTLKNFNLADTWVRALDVEGATWQSLGVAPPGPGRSMAKAVYDPVLHRMIVFGGTNLYGEDVGAETLALDLEVGAEGWTTLSPTTWPPGSQERRGFGLLYDSTRNRIVMMGGIQGYGGLALFGDIWALPLDDPGAGWIELTQSGPGPAPLFVGTNAFHEPMVDRYYVLPGELYHTTAQFIPQGASAYERSIWSLLPHDDDSVTWTELRTVLPGPILDAHVHWIPERAYGLSLYGLVIDEQPGGSSYYHEGVRTYSILEPKAPWEW